MKKQKSDYSYLIGKNKNELLEDLGDEFNIPYSKTWCYIVHVNFFTTKKLILYFDDDHRVERCELKRSFFKM